MTTPRLLYLVIAQAISRDADQDDDGVEIEAVNVRPQGLYINTADGKQFRLTAHEVIRP